MQPDSTESSATSTGTIVLNQNALKPKNSQTQSHSVSQMSLQSTGISGCQLSASTHKSPTSSKVLSSYSNKEQQTPSQQQHPQPHQLLQLPSNSPNSSSCSNSISSSASTINTTGIFLFSLSLCHILS
jgi:septum formation inhibitor MinC